MDAVHHRPHSTAIPPCRASKARRLGRRAITAKRRTSSAPKCAALRPAERSPRSGEPLPHRSAQHFGAALRDVAQRERVAEGPKLLQALVLDLPDALARDVERPPYLVERARVLAVEAVAELEHAALAVRERPEDLPQQLLAHRLVRDLVRKRDVLVGEEVAELGLLLVADGLLQRDRSLRATHDLLHLFDRQVEVERDLDRHRLAAELRAQLALGAHDLVQLLDDVHRHADRARLVGELTGDRLANPPRRVRRELEALAVVELLRRAHEADRPLLDQVKERQALVAIALRDRDDEAQVRLDHLLLRAVVAALDPLRKLDFLRRGEQLDLADVLEEELQRVGRDLARLGFRFLVLLHLDRCHHFDVQLFERAVEVVQLAGVEVELVQCKRDLLRAQRAAGCLRGLEEVTCLTRVQNVRDLANLPHFLRAHWAPCLGDAALCLPHRTRAMGRSAHHFRCLDPLPARASRSAVAWRAYTEPGSVETASRSCALPFATCLVHRRSTPRWRRTTEAFGNVAVSGPSFGNDANGCAGEKEATASATRTSGSCGARAAAASIRRFADTGRSRSHRRIPLSSRARARGAIAAASTTIGGSPGATFGWRKSSAVTADGESGSSFAAFRQLATASASRPDQ